MKVAVYTICKNEEKHVDRFMDACEGADGVFILDTGSSDNSVQRLRDRGAIVKEVSYDDFDFSVARNENLAMIPEDYSVCVCVDLDEVLHEGWRAHIDKVWFDGVNRLEYTYLQNGDSGACTHHKIHSRYGWHWIYPIHEELEQLEEPELAYHCSLVVSHHPDTGKDRSHYIPMLEKAISQYPDNARFRLHYAAELIRQNELFKARLALLNVTDNNDAWNIDRAYACMISAGLVARDEQIPWLRQAVCEAPDWREPWFKLAGALYKLKRYSSALVAAQRAMDCTHRYAVNYADDACWGPMMYELLARCQSACDELDEAIGTTMKGCRVYPDSEELADLHGALTS